jgi:hypothetical protein
MTQDEIIEMADECGLAGYFELDGDSVGQLMVTAFAKLVAEKEREACANLCWKSEEDNAFVSSYNGKRIDLLCAELIRARGQA